MTPSRTSARLTWRPTPQHSSLTVLVATMPCALPFPFDVSFLRLFWTHGPSTLTYLRLRTRSLGFPPAGGRTVTQQYLIICCESFFCMLVFSAGNQRAVKFYFSVISCVKFYSRTLRKVHRL